MTFHEVLNETTLFTHGGAPKTLHDPKRSKFASKKIKKKNKNKNIHLRDYEKAIRDGTAYSLWIHPVRSKI